MNKKLDGAVVISVMTAFLYCSWTAFYNGKLSSMSIDLTMMEMSFHQTIYFGFRYFFGSEFNLIALLIFVFVMPLLYLIKWVLYWILEKWLIGNKNRKTISDSGDMQEFEKGIGNLSYAVYIGVMTLAFIPIFSLFQDQGKEFGKKIMEAHYSDSGKITEILVQIDGSDKALNFLECGSKNCAGIEKVTNRVYIFPQSSGYSFVNTNKFKDLQKTQTKQTTTD